jgi:hypothetical protein
MPSTLRGTGKDRTIEKGHGTSALGPSGSSDTGSDITGGPGLVEGVVLGIDEPGATSDPDRGGKTAGPDIGDADVDSDSDSTGSGERRTAGRDPDEPEDVDRKPDRIESTVPATGEQSGLATDKGAGTTGRGRDAEGGGSGGVV